MTEKETIKGSYSSNTLRDSFFLFILRHFSTQRIVSFRTLVLDQQQNIIDSGQSAEADSSRYFWQMPLSLLFKEYGPF